MDTALSFDKALLATPPSPKPPTSSLIVEVARKHNVSPFRQLREMISLSLGQGKLSMHEYYSSGSYDPALTAVQKREFVGETGSLKLNCKLSPVRTTPTRSFIRNKVMYSALLEQLGLRTTKTQAVFGNDRSYGNILTLCDAEGIVQFLTNAADYPIFGKPVEGSKSVGSVLISGIDRDAGVLKLANGRKTSVADFAAEVVEDYEHGFIFQSAIEQHPDMQRVTGDAVGTLRVVTIRDGNGVEPLYSVWKIPAPTAMSDNFWQDGSMVAQVDVASGQLGQCKRGSGLDAEWIDAHPVNGEVFVGYQIPHWEATKSLAVQGHELFPEFGVFGWDIAITPDGPLIIECNANPFHSLYQIATGRGILNEDFKPRFEAAANHSNPSRKPKA